MAIKSNSFGRVSLTGVDAAKFKNQVTYGKPKAAASSSLERGVDMVRQFQTNGGRFTFTAPSKK
jgi:hypothetical protein